MATPMAALSSAAPAAAPEAVDLLGLRIHRVTIPQALSHALTLARAAKVSLVLTPNVDHVLRVRRDAEFRGFYAAADFVVADGQPVVWASRLLGKPLPERVAGSDLTPALCEAAAREGLRYYFIGGNPGDAERAAQVIAARAGRDGCAGIDCPPFGFEKDPAYLEQLLSKLRAAQPHIICVGLGSPKQERLMLQLRERLASGALFGVGVTFSFIAGTVKRAPKWLRKVGLEWLWRLACEPRRLWRRYLDNLLHFPWLVLKAKFGRG